MVRACTFACILSVYFRYAPRLRVAHLKLRLVADRWGRGQQVEVQAPDLVDRHLCRVPAHLFHPPTPAPFAPACNACMHAAAGARGSVAALESETAAAAAVCSECAAERLVLVAC